MSFNVQKSVYFNAPPLLVSAPRFLCSGDGTEYAQLKQKHSTTLGLVYTVLKIVSV